MEKRAPEFGAWIATRVDLGKDSPHQSAPPIPRMTSRQLECDRRTPGVRAYDSWRALTRAEALQPPRFLRRPRLYRARRAATGTPIQVPATIRFRTEPVAMPDLLLSRW